MTVTLIEMMKGIFEDFLDHKIIIFIFEATVFVLIKDLRYMKHNKVTKDVMRD